MKTTSLALSKELDKLLPEKYESKFYWANDESWTNGKNDIIQGVSVLIVKNNVKKSKKGFVVRSFTADELGELLPAGIDYIVTSTKQANRWLCRCEEIVGALRQTKHDEWEEAEADCRAKMLIYLLENKFINK